MAKKLHFRNLSDKRCSEHGCTRRLKQRIVDIKPTAHRCYRCHQATLKNTGKKYRVFKQREVYA